MCAELEMNTELLKKGEISQRQFEEIKSVLDFGRCNGKYPILDTRGQMADSAIDVLWETFSMMENVETVDVAFLT